MNTLKEAKEYIAKTKEFKLFHNNEPYDKDEDYFFVDYWNRRDLSWVRASYLTMPYVSGASKQCQMDEHRREIAKSDGDKVYPRPTIRVNSERYLDLPYENWNEELACYVPDDLENNRTKLYGGRFESAIYQTGQLPLIRFDDETKEDWFKRIKTDKRTSDRYKHLDFVDGKFIKIEKEAK